MPLNLLTKLEHFTRTNVLYAGKNEQQLFYTLPDTMTMAIGDHKDAESESVTATEKKSTDKPVLYGN